VVDEPAVGQKYRLLKRHLDERSLRVWAAAEASVEGRGGVTAVARATGIARSTLHRGVVDLEAEPLERRRVRRPGAGRKRLSESDPKLLEDLERLADDDARGDPMRVLQWTSKSHSHLAGALRELGHELSVRSVAPLLRRLGFSLQANVKTLEGSQHPDRDAQFRYINERVGEALAAEQPAISVDTKKKELVGNYKNGGRELARKGQPVKVNGHDFPDKQLGKAAPYGVLDLKANEALVSVGVSADTAQFSLASIRAWWQQLGKQRYPDAKRLTITADCGGSNGNRPRLWKVELQQLADDTGLEINVLHYPAGTSKCNRIEHRLFSAIAVNWRGKPLLSHQVIIDLIAATTNSSGLKVYARLDPATYQKGIKVTAKQLAAVNLTRHAFHGE
jgi:transposase